MFIPHLRGKNGTITRLVRECGTLVRFVDYYTGLTFGVLMLLGKETQDSEARDKSCTLILKHRQLHHSVLSCIVSDAKVLFLNSLDMANSRTTHARDTQSD